jgi:putative DNA primase/helicase
MIAREPGTAHTDLGNAERLVARHGQDLRYVSQWGWLAWDGRRWERDTTGESVRRAKETARHMLAEATTLESTTERQLLAKHALASERAGSIMAMLQLGQSEPAVVARPEDFDRAPLLLTVKNGTIDLRTGELREWRREDMITKCAPVAFEPAADCPRWKRFLEDVMQGSAALIGFLRRAIGYSLTGDTREQCLFFLHGTGANGKGALIRTIEALLGDYFKQADFASFLERRSEGPKEDLAHLVGARFVAASEAGDGRKFAEGLLKTITGQDTLSVRLLHRDRFEYRPPFKLWLAANAKPTISGGDEGMWRRMLLVPFQRTISRSEQDQTLEPALQGEELPGILRWAVEGCLEWLEVGLRIPEEILAATGEYRTEMDVVSRFIQEQCVLGPNESEMGSVLLERLNSTVQKWERKRGNDLAAGLKRAGFKFVHTNRGNRWIGLRLRAWQNKDDVNGVTGQQVRNNGSPFNKQLEELDELRFNQ